MDEGNMEHDTLQDIFDGNIKPTDVKFSALERITGNFSEERIIGEGGFAKVYKGVLQNGEVAVKRIKSNHTIDENVFRREVNSLLNVSHENIVRLLGFCSHTEHKVLENKGSRHYIYAESRERILCFEYINNGSLQKYIADELRGLQWDTRYSIIKGICEGLHYLHEKMKIIHRDLKPANILIDNNMVAKITDFGLARMEESAQIQSTTKTSTPGYTAPEYIDSGEISVKYDVYSLGVIIIELVTGSRSIPDSNIVLRRWRHRLHKFGKETPHICQQIGKLIEIGLRCQEKKPHKRPCIAEIICDIRKIESTNRENNTANEFMVGQINPYLEDDMLGIEPLELRFPFELNRRIPCSLELTNETNDVIAFSVDKTSHLSYYIEPNKGIVSPQSKYSVKITLQPLDEAPQDKDTGSFIVRSTKVKESLRNEDINEEIFSGEDGKLVDEVNLTITYKGGSTQESNVPPTEVESKISPCTSDELIRLDHPELRFTFSQNKTSLCSVNMVNVTDYFVGFRLFNSDKAAAVSYHIDTELGILAPRSAIRLVVARLMIKEKEPKDTQYNKLFMWNAIVSERTKVSDLDCDMSLERNQSNELPIILNKIAELGATRSIWGSITSFLKKTTLSTSVQLINFEPPEVCFPFFPSKKRSSSIKIVNITDSHIGFSTHVEVTNVALYITEPPCGILLPWSTQELVVTRVIKEEVPEMEDMQCKDKYFVWSCFVTEGVNDSDLKDWIPKYERKELPIVFMETSSNELIQFDPPELCLPQVPNHRVLSSPKIINIIDKYIRFRIHTKKTNSARYYINPSEGILPPLSTQVLLVTTIAEGNDTLCNDKFFVWNDIVSEDVRASDVIDNMPETKCTEFPIVLTKQTSSSISNELIQFDLLELHFPFLPNKKVSTSFMIVNLTDYNVGFNTYSRPANAAWYHTEPPRGILPPRSTQKLIVTREEKEDGLEDKQFNDKYFVWKSIVSEGVKDSDLTDCIADQESKELPIVLDKISSSISDELIQFDPAELCIPALLNKNILVGVNVVNTTDFYVAFHTFYIRRDAARSKTSVQEGILPPRSSQKLTLNWRTTEQEFKDMQPDGDFFVWNRVVTKCVESGDIVGYMDKEESKKLHVILTKASPCTSNELIQFDPPKLNLLLSNNPLVFSFNIANITEFCVSFRILFPKRNVGMYNVRPASGVMEPRSTQRIVVKTTPKKKEQEDVQYEDALSIYSCLVMEGVDRVYYEVGKKFPIVYKKTGLCTSDELIQLDPPQLTFPFLPNKRVSMLRKFKIVNVTDYIVGFRIGDLKSNHACYIMEPSAGILSPQSTQEIKIRRTPGENETENMECKDKIIVWNGIVSEGIQASDVSEYIGDDDKELPVVLTKPGERS